MPLLWLSLAFLLGIWLASIVPLGAAAWLGLGAAALLAQGLFSLAGKQRLIHPPPLKAIPLPPLLLAAVLCFGAARHQSAQPTFSPADLGWYNERRESFEVDGVIIQPPEPRQGYTRLRL